MRLAAPDWFFFTVLLLAGGLACTSGEHAPEEAASEEPELARYMMDLQRWSHKATLAMEARNKPLADFYLHEMEEAIESMQEEAPTYEGHQVADLTERMLVPSVEALDEALDDRAWPTVDKRVQSLAQACNQCHATTDYGFIQVDLQDVPDPYAQDFTSARP